MSTAVSHGRDDVARALDAGLGDLGVVICGLGSGSRAWRELGSARPTYYGSDPMGVSLSMAGGFALARPDRPVALMVGDGDLLMGLGALVTVAGAAPSNLCVVVLANRRYETGGGRALPGSDQLDIAAVAAAAGWISVSVAGADLATDLAAALEAPGPALMVVPVRLQGRSLRRTRPVERRREARPIRTRPGSERRHSDGASPDDRRRRVMRLHQTVPLPADGR